MQFDPLNDALASIYNAEQAGFYEVTVHPVSKLLGRMLDIMQHGGYVGEYERLENGRGGEFKIKLVGRINQCGVIKPRHSVKRTDYYKCESRYLPAQDFGLLIVTPTTAVTPHNDAKDARIGGRLLAYVY